MCPHEFGLSFVYQIFLVHKMLEADPVTEIEKSLLPPAALKLLVTGRCGPEKLRGWRTARRMTMNAVCGSGTSLSWIAL
jgi:hypothetical protein